MLNLGKVLLDLVGWVEKPRARSPHAGGRRGQHAAQKRKRRKARKFAKMSRRRNRHG